MAMSDIRIRRFEATHRVADPVGAARALQAQRQLLDGDLEAALARHVPEEEIVIVRRLEIPLRLAGRHTERQSARDWGDAIARELDRQLRGGESPNVLRFRHRLAAMLAFADDTLANSGRRDWAWQRLGYVDAGGTGSVEARFDGLLRLARGNDAAATALRQALCAGPLWSCFVKRLDDTDLRDLARAALEACGGRADDWSAPGTGASPAGPGATAGGGVEAVLAPRRGSAVSLSAAHAQALAAALRAEPSSRRRRWRGRLEILLREPRAARLGTVALDAALAALQETTEAEPRTDRRSAAGSVGVQGHAAPGPFAAIDGSLFSGPAASPDVAAPVRAAWAGRVAADDGTAMVPAPAADAPPAHARAPATGHTAAGGLLLMLALLEPSGALALLEDPAVWPGESWPLALHRFATALLPLAADDPAALAFCGRRPQEPVPHPHVALGPAQTQALQAARRCLQAALHARVPQWPAGSVVERLGWRQARIVADPGWFEVRYALRDVSLDVRRAALDLDPGFVPWLGIVMRFVYE